MKTILLWLALVVKFTSIIAGLSALPALHFLPPEWMAYATLAFGVASVVKDASNRLGDLLDDGKINQSFGNGVDSAISQTVKGMANSSKYLLLVLLPVFMLTNCAGGAFLGLDKEGWSAVSKDALSGALKGATTSALPAYSRERSAKEARKVTP